MSHTEARAWWSDVEDVRERIERRRAAAAGVHPTDGSLALAPASRPRRDDVPAPARPALRVLPDTGTADERPRVRRTVQITGHGAAAPAIRPLVAHEGVSPRPRRRPAPGPMRHASHHPDRIAAWAVLLGIVLIVVAFATSGA
jgi:hypothetical protein